MSLGSESNHDLCHRGHKSLPYEAFGAPNSLHGTSKSACVPAPEKDVVR